MTQRPVTVKWIDEIASHKKNPLAVEGHENPSLPANHRKINSDNLKSSVKVSYH
jgi:hypothetical protein